MLRPLGPHRSKYEAHLIRGPRPAPGYAQMAAECGFRGYRGLGPIATLDCLFSTEPRMARPHIEYLQSQSLPWQPSPWPQLAGCHTKFLSRDPVNGAASVLVRFPADWQSSTPGHLTTSEELFVLDGALDVNGRRWGQDCYGWFPPAFSHLSRAAPDGAVALLFYDSEPTWTAAGTAGGPLSAEPAVFVDAFEMPWESVTMRPTPGIWGPTQKILRGTPESDSLTMLVAFPAHMHPHKWVGPQELHACVEELFLLSGDCLTNVGQMFPGAYFWRPPGIAHGPYGSRGGTLALLRTQGAPLSITWTSHEIALARRPEYQPVMPRELNALRSHPWRAQPY